MVSDEILSEIQRVLLEVLKNKWKAVRFVEILDQRSVHVTIRKKIAIITADPSDNKFLECAIAGKADCIVSGDKKHVLPLKHYQKIPILSPKEFLDQFEFG